METGDLVLEQVYEYILSGVKDCVWVENTHPFFTPPAHHRWTAISMGAVRDHPAIGTPSIAIDPISPESKKAGRTPDLRL